MTREAGPLIEVCVAIGGVNGKNSDKSVEIEEVEEMATVLESVVTGEISIPTVNAEFMEEVPEEVEEVHEKS